MINNPRACLYMCEMGIEHIYSIKALFENLTLPYYNNGKKCKIQCTHVTHTHTHTHQEWHNVNLIDQNNREYSKFESSHPRPRASSQWCIPMLQFWQCRYLRLLKYRLNLFKIQIALWIVAVLGRNQLLVITQALILDRRNNEMSCAHCNQGQRGRHQILAKNLHNQHDYIKYYKITLWGGAGYKKWKISMWQCVKWIVNLDYVCHA